MAVIPYEQRSYPGSAADTQLNGDITSSALAFSVSTGTGSGFPDGGSGPFFVVIDYDASTTEKIHCTARVGDSFTADVRGADGTTALSHTSGAKIRACWTATDAQEANRAAHQTVGKITAKGDLLSGTGANALAKIAAGSDGQVLTSDSTAPAGWTPKTPTNPFPLTKTATLVISSESSLDTIASSSFAAMTNFPDAVIVVPASGMVKVTIGAAIIVTALGGSPVSGLTTISWVSSGAIASGPGNDQSYSVDTRGNIQTAGEGCKVSVLRGMTPGATLTVSPRAKTAATGMTIVSGSGTLILEALP